MTHDEFGRHVQQFKRDGLLQADNVKGALTLAAELLLGLALVAGLRWVRPWGIGFLCLQALGGVAIFRWFVILHECGHKALFRPRRANTITGHLASLFCLIPYFPWRNIHLQHHRWVGVIDKDPTQRHLLKLQHAPPWQNAVFRLVWKLWLPIPFARFLFQVFWGQPLVLWRAGQRREAWRAFGSVLLCAAGQAAALGGLGPRGWCTYFLPMLGAFYVLIENMNLPQHSELFPYLSETHPQPLPCHVQDTITRSTHMSDGLSCVLALNFNRHTEHHLFAAAPWYALNKIRRRLRASGYSHPHEVQAFRFMWQLRRRDPVAIYRDALPKPSSAGPTMTIVGAEPGLPICVSLHTDRRS